MPWFKKSIATEDALLLSFVTASWLPGTEQSPLSWLRRSKLDEDIQPAEPSRRPWPWLPMAAAAIVEYMPWMRRSRLFEDPQLEQQPRFVWFQGPTHGVSDAIPWNRKPVAVELIEQEQQPRRPWVAIYDVSLLGWLRQQRVAEGSPLEESKRQTWPWLAQPVVAAIENLPWRRRRLYEPLETSEVGYQRTACAVWLAGPTVILVFGPLCLTAAQSIVLGATAGFSVSPGPTAVQSIPLGATVAETCCP